MGGILVADPEWVALLLPTPGGQHFCHRPRVGGALIITDPERVVLVGFGVLCRERFDYMTQIKIDDLRLGYLIPEWEKCTGV